MNLVPLDNGTMLRHTCHGSPFPFMNFSSDSVNDFLRKVQGAKEQQRQIVDEELEPLLTDPFTYVVPPAIATMVDNALEEWGDEALKQIAMVVIGKWLDVHNGLLEEHVNNQDFPAALFTMADATKITTVLRTLSDIGSFGGSEDYCASIRQQINQTVLENIEEQGKMPEDFFYGTK